VWIDIPKDVFLENAGNPSSINSRGNPIDDAMPNDFSRAGELIANAQRPLFYLGGGMQSYGASQALLKLQERCAIPALGTLLSLGAMPAEHPLWQGMIGMHGNPYANMALDACDLLIVAGARFDDRATGNIAHFAPQAKVIHLDVDPMEFGRLRRADCVLAGHLADSLSMLANHLSEREYPEWIFQLEELREQYPMPDQLAHGMIRQIADAADPQCFVATDVGQHQMWTAQAWPWSRPRQFLTSGGLGTMGFGMPTAIGAGLANPDQQVICISGDGSLLMNLQELATLAETGVNVKVIVFDNRGLGMVRQQQNLLLEKRFYASHFECAPDFCSIAQSFGIPSCDAEFGGDWQGLLNQPGPALIRFSIPADETVWPMVPGGKANREMLMPELETSSSMLEQEEAMPRSFR
jgi:acetolactate synthase-1/2/3 large subunit